MIVCPNCANENQDHYKFCLGCGSDLPRVEEVPTPARSTPTPATGIPSMSEESASSATQAISSEADSAATELGTPSEPSPPEPEPEPAPEPAVSTPSSDGSTCPTCGAVVSSGFAFCGACGTPMPGRETPAPVQASATESASSARLVLIRPDGSEGGHVEIPDTEVAIGRDAGGFFASDPFLSPTHAILRADNANVYVKDAESLNGIFVRIPANEPVEIRSGQIFRIGQELLLFEEIDKGGTASDGTEKMGSPIEGLWGRIALIVARGRLGNAFPIGNEGLILGRERGNILFPEDGYVSGMHVNIYADNDRFYITDLGSSNGTFIKLADEGIYPTGTFLLMGQQLFRIDS